MIIKLIKDSIITTAGTDEGKYLRVITISTFSLGVQLLKRSYTSLIFNTYFYINRIDYFTLIYIEDSPKSLDFGNEFTIFDHYNNERVIYLNHVRDCVTSVFFQGHFVGEVKFIRLLGVMDDISLMVMNGNVENLVRELSSLRVGFVQLLC